MVYDKSMISHIEGKVLHVDLQYIIIQTNGIGYKVHTPLSVTETVSEGQSTSLWTHQAVRENSLDLFGFKTRDDLEFFELLITISGIGPKSAIGILNVASVEMIKSSIIQDDISSLTKVAGIGAKSAKKIVVELKDKLHGVADETNGNSNDIDVIDALCSLGYSKKQARDAVKEINDSEMETHQKIKEALKLLSK